MIIVAGSSNTDMIVQVPRLPDPGETVLGAAFTTAAGGKGANQAVAAARCGGLVNYIGRVGKDDFGHKALAGLKKEGIGVDFTGLDESAPSGVALIFVNDEGENSIAVASGANLNFSPDDVRAASGLFRAASVVLLQMEIPMETIESVVEHAQMNDVPVILNPAPMQPLSNSLLSRVSILTPNMNEASELADMEVNSVQSAEEAGRKIIQRGAKIVVVTLGVQGSVIVTLAGATHVPAFDVSAVDATSAGDTFNGALAVALSEEMPLEEAVRFATAAAALSVKRLGAQPSIPLRAQVDTFLLYGDPD
jgi:ribokinase